MKKIKKCLACEIAGKTKKATKEIDGMDLCTAHWIVYTGQLEPIVHEKPTD
jgi:hypothetical protein